MSKKEKAVAKSIAKHIAKTGNSADKRRMIEVVADAFCTLDHLFDRNKFYDMSYHHWTVTPTIPVADVVRLLRALNANPEATVQEAIDRTADLLLSVPGFTPEVYEAVINAPQEAHHEHEQERLRANRRGY
jgi:hypothetical protein